MTSERETRLQPIKGGTVCLCNQDVIEFAYAVRDLYRTNPPAFFEDSNCYASVFAKVKQWLQRVDTEYLKQHQDVVKFFGDRS